MQRDAFTAVYTTCIKRFIFLGTFGVRQETELHKVFALITTEKHLTATFPKNFQNLHGQDALIPHDDHEATGPSCLRVG